MAPWRASTTKSEWLPDDPTAFAPSRLWKLLCITIWGDSQNQNLPTDSAEEGEIGRQPLSRLPVGRLLRWMASHPFSHYVSKQLLFSEDCPNSLYPSCSRSRERRRRRCGSRRLPV